MSFYRQIIRRALSLAWRYKFLWIFGIFAALSGNTGELGLYYRNIRLTIYQPTIWVREINSLHEDPNLLHWLWRYLKLFYQSLVGLEPYQQLSLFLIIGIILVLFVIVVCLITFGQVSLISATEKIANKKTVTFSELIRTGLHYFWKLIIINAFGRGLVYLILILFDIPLILFLAKGSMFGASLFAILLFVVIVPLGMAASFIIRYASCYLVLRKKNVKEAIKSAYRIFIKYPVVTLEMSIIVLVVNTLIGAIIFIPLFFLSRQIVDMLNTVGGFFIVLIIDSILFITLLAFLGAFLSTFQLSAWTMLFLRLIGPQKTYSKFARVFRFLPKNINNNSKGKTLEQFKS